MPNKRSRSKTCEDLNIIESADLYLTHTTSNVFIYEDPRTGELFHYARKGTYTKNGRTLRFVKKAKAEYPGFSERESMILDRLTEMLKNWEDKQHPYFKDLAGFVAELMEEVE